ncbi:MAG: TlpA family protein disulfide reductase [Calditrichaeota bacterium]|nr:MAG: TlpA family protein disulfide reductase [Calditrichota bacterium]
MLDPTLQLNLARFLKSQTYWGLCAMPCFPAFVRKRNSLHRLGAWLLTLLLVVLLLSASRMPQFRLKDLKNHWQRWEDVRGPRLTVVDFWATWCKPCLRMIPHLEKIHQQYASKGVAVVGVNVDSPRNLSKVPPLVRQLGIGYTVLLDPNNELMDALHIQAVPTLLVVDSTGEIRYFHEGYRPGDETELTRFLDKLLNQSGGGNEQ